LAGISLKAGKTIKRVSILVKQLKKVSLFLVVVREEEAAIILRIGYTIYRLMTPRV
jgi:hypothetical protein